MGNSTVIATPDTNLKAGRERARRAAAQERVALGHGTGALIVRSVRLGRARVQTLVNDPRLGRRLLWADRDKVAAEHKLIVGLLLARHALESLLPVPGAVCVVEEKKVER